VKLRAESRARILELGGEGRGEERMIGVITLLRRRKEIYAVYVLLHFAQQRKVDPVSLKAARLG